MTILFGIAMFCTALFLIVLVLVQRGRGGGLSGALGGMGGQSAFGTKAGDVFTRFTIGAATFWILLCIAAILVLNPQRTNKKRVRSGLAIPVGEIGRWRAGIGFQRQGGDRNGSRCGDCRDCRGAWFFDARSAVWGPDLAAPRARRPGARRAGARRADGRQDRTRPAGQCGDCLCRWGA